MSAGLATPVRPSPTRDAVRVLVVEDSPDHRLLIERALHGAGCAVTSVATGEQARDLLDDAHVVLVDQRLPQMSGTDLLREIVAMRTGPAAVVVTGTQSHELVVEALRLGAVDYVVKASGYLDQLPAVVERAHRQHDLARRYRELQRFALLVHRPTVRADAVDEVVRGARTLLDADGVALLQRDPDRVEVVASDGNAVDLDHVGPALVEAERSGRPTLAEGAAVVPLPVGADDVPGALVLGRVGRPEFSPEELELATTFAALTTSALRQVRRLELERGVVRQLERAVQARQDFLASVSHELRTPLTVIVGYVETLLHRAGAVPPEDRATLLARVASNAHELDRLIDQLLDVAAIERGRALRSDPQPIDLGEVVEAATAEVAFHLDGRGGERAVPSLTVVADRGLLRMALVNLLSNACKYSDAGAPVDVRARVEGEVVRVEVRDRGVGLSPAEVAQVFSPFWRGGHAVRTAVRGTGIGLSLVREYVTTMGGQVGVDAEPGRGSTFWLTLPLAEPGDAGTGPGDVGTGREQPRR